MSSKSWISNNFCYLVQVNVALSKDVKIHKYITN